MVNKKKCVVHQISLKGIGGGEQRSFFEYYKMAKEKSLFSQLIFGMHDLEEHYKPFGFNYVNMSKSIKDRLSFFRHLIDNNSIVQFNNNLGSRSVHRLLKFLPTSKIIFHEHGRAWNAPQKEKDIYIENTNKADIIIANSRATKTLLIKKFGLPPEKIKIVYYGFADPKVEKATLKRDKKIVGFMGRLDQHKGFPSFLRLAKRLRKRKDILFRIGGGGPLEEYVRREAKGAENVECCGIIRDPLKFISDLDLFIVPSIREPFGIVVLEAGFSRKPVIASRVDGIPEIIDDGISGILVKPKDDIKALDLSSLPDGSAPVPEYVVDPDKGDIVPPKELNAEELEDIVVSLLKDEERMKSMGEALYDKAVTRFTQDAYFNNLEEIHKGIFNER